MFKTVIYASIIIPIFITSFILFYIKKRDLRIKAMIISFFAAASWLMFTLLILLTTFLYTSYKGIAIYLMLIIMLVIFGFLAYYAQIKFSREHEMKKEKEEIKNKDKDKDDKKNQPAKK